MGHRPTTVRAAELVVKEGPSVQVIVEILRSLSENHAIGRAFSVASAGAAAFGWAVAQPIERLTRSAQRIAQGGSQRGLPAPIGQEVRALTDAMLSMRNALESLEAFVADLSHELKNPVAAIKAASEVLREGAPKSRLKDRFLARIDEASQRLEVLTKDLLALARREARGARLQRSMLNLVEVIDAAKDTYLSQAENKGVTIEFLAESVRIRGDRHWLIRAVGNLIANALRYSPSH